MMLGALSRNTYSKSDLLSRLFWVVRVSISHSGGLGSHDESSRSSRNKIRDDMCNQDGHMPYILLLAWKSYAPFNSPPPSHQVSGGVNPNHDQSPQAVSGFYDDTVNPDNNLLHIFCVFFSLVWVLKCLQVESEAGPSDSVLEPNIPMSPSQTPTPPPTVSTRCSGHSICLLARYTDYLLTRDSLQYVPSPPPSTHSSYQALPLSADLSVHDQDPQWLIECRTLPNEMGLFQLYPTQPFFILRGNANILSVICTYSHLFHTYCTILSKQCISNPSRSHCLWCT